MSYLQVTELTYGYGDKLLYKNAELSLYAGEHMGVVGPNGAGKSTLIGILTGEIIPDEGRVWRQPGITYGYLDQFAAADENLSILDYLKTAFTPLYEAERQMLAHYEEYTKTEKEALLLQAAQLQQQLDAGDFYRIDTEIEQTASGLGLASLGLETRLGNLSGGQRAKVILAKLLLCAPDVLLLDEPTNFLDAGQVDWLAGYLKDFPNAFLAVSHDYSFLERISTCICDIENGMIRKYHGEYSDFLVQKEHLREEYLRMYQSQQQMLKREEEYIRRNIAGVNSRIAKGRRKRLERVERLEAPAASLIRPKITFPAASCNCREILQVKGLQIGYDFPLLKPLSFHLNAGQRMVLTGFNGIGKSTLLKTLLGLIPSLGGWYRFAEQVKVGYYEQELRWDSPEDTPFTLLSRTVPTLTAKEIRRHLSLYGLQNEHIDQPLSRLSGGEQSRVKLCRLSLFPCNLLILDEPTNHLDAPSKEALLNALLAFKGGLLLVSHEPEFYKKLDAKILNISES